MPQSITVPSALIPVGTQTLGNILLVSNIFTSYFAHFDISGASSLSGSVAILTISLSADGTNFTDFDPITINGGPIRSNGTTFNMGVRVNPNRTFTRIKATLQTLQPWITAITIVVN